MGGARVTLVDTSTRTVCDRIVDGVGVVGYTVSLRTVVFYIAEDLVIRLGGKSSNALALDRREPVLGTDCIFSLL